MKITVANAKHIVKTGEKVFNNQGVLLGYKLEAFYRFRNCFICKDGVSGKMLISGDGATTEDVKYVDYTGSDTAYEILGLGRF